MENKISALKVSDNHRYLVKEDGSLFFWMGDTAWNLFNKLSKDEAELYLHNRAERQFNVIQAVALAPYIGGLTGNVYGKLPLLVNDEGEYDPSLPDVTAGSYNYWDHVDYIAQKAEELGMYIAFLPTWGDKINKQTSSSPEIFTEENARQFGQFLGRRYMDQKNIIWVLGGDRILNTRSHFNIIHEMAQGIKDGDQGRHLMTFHPHGEGNSSHSMHDEEWLDMNMIQSGHHPIIANYQMINDAYQRSPIKPVLDGEPNYEDISIAFKAENGFIDAADVRRSAYWSVFAGAYGHTYGQHSVWNMESEPYPTKSMHWKQAIERPGAAQMQHLRKLAESRNFLEHFPDQSIITENYEGANYMQASRCNDCAMIYVPCGMIFKANMEILTGERLKTYWYNPRNGSSTFNGIVENKRELQFHPPTSGRGEDWVLLMEDVNTDYPGL